MVLKASHTFNLLDARGAISVTERAAYIGRVRALARAVAQAYYDSREKLGFPDGAGLGDGEEAAAAPRAQTLLVELLTEELPPKALDALGRSFRDHLANDLEQAGLRTERERVALLRHAAAPGRVASRTCAPRPPRCATRCSGPSAKAPEQAVSGFARKHGVDTLQLEQDRDAERHRLRRASARCRAILLADVLAAARRSRAQGRCRSPR